MCLRIPLQLLIYQSILVLFGSRIIWKLEFGYLHNFHWVRFKIARNYQLQQQRYAEQQLHCRTTGRPAEQQTRLQSWALGSMSRDYQRLESMVYGAVHKGRSHQITILILQIDTFLSTYILLHFNTIHAVQLLWGCGGQNGSFLWMSFMDSSY